MEPIGIEQARQTLGEIVDRARYTGELTVITRNGKPAAVVVGITDDLHLLLPDVTVTGPQTIGPGHLTKLGVPSLWDPIDRSGETEPADPAEVRCDSFTIKEPDQ